MNARSRRLRRQRRKDARDPHRHQPKTIAFREQVSRHHQQRCASRQARKRYAQIVTSPAADPTKLESPPLTGGALLTTMLQGKPIQ